MNPAITRIVYKNNLDSTGDDFLWIYIFFKVDDSKEFQMPIMFNLDDLFEFIEKQYPEKGKYLKRIRRSIYGYGPKHSKILETIEEEGFDLDQHIQAYFDSHEDDYFEWAIERNNKNSTPKSQEQISEKVEKINDYIEVNNLRAEQIKYVAFQEAIDTALHQATLKYYPDLFEMGEKHEYAYKGVLIDTVLEFVSEIDKIRFSKFSENFNKEYQRRNKDS